MLGTSGDEGLLLSRLREAPPLHKVGVACPAPVWDVQEKENPMKLEDLPTQLRDAANAAQKLGGDAYATARKKFLDALAAHTGDLDKAQQSADELLEQARTASGDVFARARAKSEELLNKAGAKSEELVQKAKDKLEKK